MNEFERCEKHVANLKLLFEQNGRDAEQLIRYVAAALAQRDVLIRGLESYTQGIVLRRK
jgi:hypothetical protein